MKAGDRVKVVDQASEYIGCVGTMVGFHKDGRIIVNIDRPGWEVSFKPHDIELVAEVPPEEAIF